jgi:hypothetical protein
MMAAPTHNIAFNQRKIALAGLSLLRDSADMPLAEGVAVVGGELSPAPSFLVFTYQGNQQRFPLFKLENKLESQYPIWNLEDLGHSKYAIMIAGGARMVIDTEDDAWLGICLDSALTWLKHADQCVIQLIEDPKEKRAMWQKWFKRTPE